MIPLRRAAYEYLERGWSILPVRADKTPIGTWKQFQSRHATTDEVESWFRNGCAGIGVLGGPISGLFILDVEAHGTHLFRDVPSTLTARSQSGGFHFYLKWRPGAWKAWLAQGGQHVGDLRGDGAYVVAPPTVGVNGSYQWVCLDPIADIPDSFRRPPDAEEVPDKRCPPASTDFVSGREYASRSERLLAVARRCVENGGDVEDVLSACLADYAGSKISSRKPEGQRAYAEHLYYRSKLFIGRSRSGTTVEAKIVSVKHSVTPKGKRITLELETDKGRIREGVTLIEGNERTVAFLKAVPKAEAGATVRIEIYETSWKGHPKWRVRRWL